MSISEAGWAAFERICLDIVNGLAHWIERGPYDSRVARQRPDDDEDEDGDERGI